MWWELPSFKCDEYFMTRRQTVKLSDDSMDGGNTEKSFFSSFFYIKEHVASSFV